MTERRYRDEEVREIFDLATTRPLADSPASSTPDGLTLADIQSIGREVGIEPAAVARAAASLDAVPPEASRRTAFGLPIGVSRTVQIPRAPTDREWDLLVGELRMTFGAQGRITIQGGLRTWSNGNLYATIEPTETAYRLRLGTLKRNATALDTVGIAGIGFGAVALGGLIVSGGALEPMFGPIMIGVGGLAALIYNRGRMPRWANRREQQMDAIATKFCAIMEGQKAIPPE